MSGNYPFVDTIQYRFHHQGQGTSVATTGDSTDVHVIETDNTSPHQLWTADVDKNTGAVRFRNEGTQAYLEKIKCNDFLKAESKEHKDDFQFFEARHSKIGG